MKGIHHIIVQNETLRYEFDIKRNITIIKGDSASGKTTLIEMIQEYLVNGADSGVSMSCDSECRVLTGNMWRDQLRGAVNAIIFIDEGNRFVSSKDFAGEVRDSSNYFVIITRENLEMLPISVDEIYGIRSSGKYGGLTPVYHQFYQIYDFGRRESVPVQPEALIVEDSNSGYEFFNDIAKEIDISCVSANGKSNIFKMLSKNSVEQSMVVIADGAAFGSQMNRIEHLVKSNQNIHLYLPESFEWILLKSGVIRNSEIREVLESPSDYVESQKYFSWEQFFTALLIRTTQDGYLKYSKIKLNPNYLQNSIKKKIVNSIKGISFSRGRNHI